jgi:hypothetical protein
LKNVNQKHQMKKITLAIIGVFLLLQTKAQTEFGIRLGTNISKVSSRNGGAAGNATALIDIALPVRIGITKGLFIMPELHFIQKGQKLNFTDIGGVESRGRYYNNYIELPILIGYGYGASDDFFTFYGGVGPFVGYAISSRVVSNIGSGDKMRQKIEFDNSYDGDLSKDMRLDAGLAAGAGIGLLAGPGKVTFDLRMNFDMVDARKFQNERPNGYQGTFNFGFGIGVGYNFIIN